MKRMLIDHIYLITDRLTNGGLSRSWVICAMYRDDGETIATDLPLILHALVHSYMWYVQNRKPWPSQARDKCKAIWKRVTINVDEKDWIGRRIYATWDRSKTNIPCNLRKWQLKVPGVELQGNNNGSPHLLYKQQPTLLWRWEFPTLRWFIIWLNGYFIY